VSRLLAGFFASESMAVRGRGWGEKLTPLRRRDTPTSLSSSLCIESRPMSVKTEAVGKEWPATTYEVGKEKIGEYARVVGLENPVHFDREAAKAAGYRDVVAPPMFCVVYSAPALGPAMFDDEVGMNFAAMVHGGQEFEWGEPACSGDEITTTAKCLEIYEKDGKGFYVFQTDSVNQDGAEVVRGTWTNIVRGV